MTLELLFQIILLSSWPMNALAQAQRSTNCTFKCGGVEIPFPFGIEDGCYFDDWFAIDCNSSRPFIRSIKLEVLEISVTTSKIQVNHPIFNSCQNQSSGQFVNLEATPYEFSHIENIFTGASCNRLATLSSDNSLITGCFSICDGVTNDTGLSYGCSSGINCCQTTISSPLKKFNASVDAPISNISSGGRHRDCKYAFLVDQKWLANRSTSLQDIQAMTHVPVRMNWGIYNSTFNLDVLKKSKSSFMSTSRCDFDKRIVQCNCFSGYQGNPYLLEGCQDIDECSLGACPSIMSCQNTIGSYNCAFKVENQKPKISMVAMVVLGFSVGFVGLLPFVIGGLSLYTTIKKRKEIKLKQKFFKQNGGLLLQQQLTSSDGSVDRSKLFNSEDLDKATDHFSTNRILGQGGQGTVYKGMLSDGRIVAIKKSKLIDKSKVDEFINEVVILSQINHRNIVKLLGCCLETEVPLLVYEFIPNGSLFQYLHDQNEELSITWDMRLRIAAEVAEALYYLHSAASMPIYHRDIKSTNILLDEKFRAKVADFGASKSIVVDQTHVTTKVFGTFGYLDPAYFRTGQFSDKSDVYSFGVVLGELLTGEKAISSTRTEEYKGLAAYFIHSMEENHLYDILDAQVLKMGKTEEIMAMANLAEKCLQMNGKKRPTMKEVSMELENIRSSLKDGNVEQSHQEVGYSRTESFESCDFNSDSTGSPFD